MTEEEQLFHSVGSEIEESEKSQMFGKPCYKINKKAFACFFQDAMVFKLSGIAHQKAINLNGAVLFDPSGKNRPMKEWVQVPVNHKDKWKVYAQEAANYISGK